MRNFLYNRSDILTAILIIVVAAGIVFWRVGVIMNYASGDKGGTNDFSALISPWTQGSSGGAAAQTPPAGASGGASTAQTPPADTVQTPPADTTQTPPADTTQTPPADTTQTPPADNTQTPPAETGTVSFTVNPGDVASVIAKNLAAAGLVNTADDFLAKVNDRNVASSLKAGTFDIPKGATADQIVDILTK